MQRGIIGGKHPTELARDLRKRFNVSKNNADRLMRTELARVQIEAQKQSYEQYGFDMYEFIANIGCCPICAAMDGKKFKTIDLTPGVNAAPLHPNCKCSTTSVFDDRDYDEWLNAISDGTFDGSLKDWQNGRGRDSTITLTEKKANIFSSHVHFKTGNEMDSFRYAKNKSLGRDRLELEQKIKDGSIDAKQFYDSREYFNKIFDKCVDSPIEKVYDKNDRYYHIVNHHDNMLGKEKIDLIVKSIKNPYGIYNSQDSFGNKAKCYVNKKIIYL